MTLKLRNPFFSEIAVLPNRLICGPVFRKNPIYFKRLSSQLTTAKTRQSEADKKG